MPWSIIYQFANNFSNEDSEKNQKTEKHGPMSNEVMCSDFLLLSL